MKRLAALALAATCGLACQNLQDVDQEVDGYAEATDMVTQLALAACGWNELCCTQEEQSYDFGLDFFSRIECANRVVISLQAGQSHPAVPSLYDHILLEAARDIGLGRVEVDEAAVAACADFLEARTCNSYVAPLGENCLPGGSSSDDPCAPESLLIGLVPPGGECTLDYQCEQGRCEGLFGLGSCNATQPLGGSCTFDYECSPGLYCDPYEQQCSVGSELGQICTYANPLEPIEGTETRRCAEGLFCDPLQARCVAPCTNGAKCTNDLECPVGLTCAVDRCREIGQAGAPCDSPVDCESRRCDFVVGVCLDSLPTGTPCTASLDCESGYCDPNELLCTEKLELGEPCPNFDDDACRDGFCDASDVLMPSCRAYIDEGEACDPINDRCDPDPDNEANLTCADDECRAIPFDNGVSCPTDDWCESQICREGVCIEGGQLGDACSNLQTTVPCAKELFCNRLSGEIIGFCDTVLPPGAPCTEHSQCWGLCELRWGRLMCDATFSPHEEEAWCDAPSGFDAAPSAR